MRGRPGSDAMSAGIGCPPAGHESDAVLKGSPSPIPCSHTSSTRPGYESNPKRGLSRAIWTINSRTSSTAGGQPIRGRRVYAAHLLRTGARCQPSAGYHAPFGRSTPEPHQPPVASRFADAAFTRHISSAPAHGASRAPSPAGLTAQPKQIVEASPRLIQRMEVTQKLLELRRAAVHRQGHWISGGNLQVAKLS